MTPVRAGLRLAFVVAAVVALGAACTPKDQVPPGAAPLRYRDLVFGTVTTTKNVTYGSAVDQQGNRVTLKLDLYRPSGDNVTARPAIVWVHGGSFKSGDKTATEIVDEATTFAKKGYVTASINYRLSTNGCTSTASLLSCLRAISDAMHDAQAAVRYLRATAATYGVDASRIAIGGSSAGAVTALNVGFNPDDPGTSGNPGFSSAVGAAVSLSGGKVLGTANTGDAPCLLFHGTADFTTPYQLAVNTVNEATAAGLLALLTTWDGAGHVPYADHRNEIIDQTTNFLYWELDLTHAAQ